MTTLAQQPKKSNSTLYLVLSFGVLILILFDPFGWGLRSKLGSAVGYVFDPIIGFHSDTHTNQPGWYPLATILLASIILVVGTTAIRHFLVDWVKMARVQEAMRSFQKEFMQARKDNNTYKIKKLTDAQPEVMAMQADLSTEQLKPMAWTMLLVIPIFAWLGAFVVLPAYYDVDHAPAGEVILVGMDVKNPVESHVVGPGATSTHFGGRDFVVYAVKPPGSGATGPMHFSAQHGTGSFDVDASKAVSIGANQTLGPIAAGTYTVTFAHAGTDDNDLHLDDGTKIGAVVVVASNAATGQTQDVVATPVESQLVVNDGDVVYAIIPAEHTSVAAIGHGKLTLKPTTGSASATSYEIGAANTVPLPADAGVRVQPHEIRAPWNPHWSMFQGFGFFGHIGFIPHWIVLYSLFGIPIGQLAQRALKLWEYRHHEVELESIGGA